MIKYVAEFTSMQPEHPYTQIVHHLNEAMRLLSEQGYEPTLSKGKVGEFITALAVDMRVSDGGGGADIVDGQGRVYEVKYSQDDQFNFNIGRWLPEQESNQRLEQKFGHMEGAYLTLAEGHTIQSILYLPMNSFLPVIREHCAAIPEPNTHQFNGNLQTWSERVDGSYFVI